MLRAFHVANPSEQAAPLGSFETWSRWVREPLLWLGWDDPCQTTSQARADDPERERLEALLLAWYGTFTSDQDGCRGDRGRQRPAWRLVPEHRSTGSSLIDALGSEKQLESETLGYYLKNRRHRMVKDFRFEREGKDWRATKLVKQTLVT